MDTLNYLSFYLSKINLKLFPINVVAPCNKGYIFPQTEICGEEYSLTCVLNKFHIFVAKARTVTERKIGI